MSKTAKFELIGTILDHPKHADLSKGDVLTLEVGDDGLPTSELFRSRTRPLGRSVEEDSGDVKGAKVQAKKLTDDAKAEAAKIVEDAKAEAKKLTDDATLVLQTAQAEADDIKAKALKDVK